MNDQAIQNLMKQRAALMGIATGILTHEDLTLEQIRNSIVNALAELIDREAMVGDLIEVLTFQKAQEYAQGQFAIQEFKDILGEN